MSRDDAGATPAAALQSIDDLLDAEHPSTTASMALAAVTAAVADDPTGTGDPGWNLASLTARFTTCETGDPSASGDPDEARAMACGRLILFLFQSYRVSGVAADDQAALAVYDFGLTTLSHVATAAGGARDAWTDVVPGFLRQAALP